MTNSPGMTRPFAVVAIDGGAASGKSSTSRRIAASCNFLHVDTGSHYRAVAFACLQAGVPAADSPQLRGFVASLQLCSRIVGNESFIHFGDGIPPRERDIRSEAVNQTVSAYAALPFLREAVKAYQRGQVELARRNGFAGVIMDGRDIGTVILPEADLKVFLTADAATRQRRRELEGTSDAVSDRDRQDSSRATAPLMAARDAVVIDNSSLSLDEVVERVLALLPGRAPAP